LDTPDFGGQVLDKRAQSAELIVFGSVNCESLQSKSCCAPRYDKKQELWALELVVPLGIAYIYVSLFDGAAAALIRSKYEH